MLVLEQKMERHRAENRGAENVMEVKLLLHMAVLVQVELTCLSSCRLKYCVSVIVFCQLLVVCSE